MRSEGYSSCSVCLLSHISPLERLFVLKILSRTQRATKVKKFVGFSLKSLRCWDPGLSPLKAICRVGHFSAESAHAHYSMGHEYPETWWRRGFCTLVHSFLMSSSLLLPASCFYAFWHFISTSFMKICFNVFAFVYLECHMLEEHTLILAYSTSISYFLVLSPEKLIRITYV